MKNIIDKKISILKTRNGLIRDDEGLVAQQITTLKNKGTADIVVSLLEQQVDALLARMKNTDVRTGNIPFIPVIPASYSTIFDQIKMIDLYGDPGGSYLEASSLYDILEPMTEPYWIIDVSTGSENLGRVPDQIDYGERQPVNCVEAIGLCLHTDVLSQHAIDVPGSRVKDDNRIPHVYSTATRAEIGYSYKEPHAHWGSPSYGCRWRKENNGI